MGHPKFIRLTDREDRSERVNSDRIVRYFPNNGGTTVVYGDDHCERYVQTPEQIDALLNMTGITAPKGFPPVGSMVLISGNNSDGPEGMRTYGGAALVVAYTPDGLFGLFQRPGHWPFVERLGNCRFLAPATKASDEA